MRALRPYVRLHPRNGNKAVSEVSEVSEINEVSEVGEVREIAVVIGPGSIGLAIARRDGRGHPGDQAAGVSPTQASIERVLHVDLLGTAYVLDAFARVIAPGRVGIVVASVAGHRESPYPREIEHALATVETSRLLALPFLRPERLGSSVHAYTMSSTVTRSLSPSLSANTVVACAEPVWRQPTVARPAAPQ